MELSGKIIAVLEERSGTNKAGSNWKCRQYVLETMDKYPQRMSFEVFGEDKINSMNIQAGETLTVWFDVDAREYNGKWFNQIRAWKVERPYGQVQTSATSSISPFEPFPPQSPNDDLPFDQDNFPF